MPLSLGIDIGTSKVAVAVGDPQTRDCLHSAKISPTADLPNLPPGFCEQDVAAIRRAVVHGIQAVPRELRNQVSTLGFAGQMHGVVLWSSTDATTSNLVTWQDKRTDGEFLARLNRLVGVSTPLSAGFGLVTLAWLVANAPQVLKQFDRCGTIHDLIAAEFRGGVAAPALMDPTNAHSFGLFDVQRRAWLGDKIRALGVPESLVPRVVRVGERIGVITDTMADELLLPRGVVIAAPVGDNQASALDSLGVAEDRVGLSLGTSGQISAVVENFAAAQAAIAASEESRLEVRPYIGERCLLVGAVLSGGRSLRVIAESFRRDCEAMGMTPPPDDQLYAHLDRLALERFETDLVANPSIDGERWNPSMRGSFTNVNGDNFSVGDMMAAAARATVANLTALMPNTVLTSRKKLVGSGNAIRQLEVVKLAIAQKTGLELLVIPEKEEAALGAAWLAAGG